MKSKLRFACAALLAVTALPALALQLGEIQVRSALNQPLVAAIPLHPENLTELDGLNVGLASAQDFARAGLRITPTDQTLQFHVVTDNNGQKLILVTSTQPVTAPYLDFLLQVNTREGKQLREFVVLLNPVIAAPAPAVQAPPVAATPPPGAATPAAQLPAPSEFPRPVSSAAPQSAPAARTASATPTQPAHPPTGINVHYGDTLYGIASGMARASDVSINQMMLALKAANPDAFFKDNINDLKAGAILRIPTRELIDRRSAAVAAAEVHRQYEVWRAAKPRPATVVEGTAAQAAANAAPKATAAPPASDHLTLAPPGGAGGGASSRTGVAGGTGSATVAGLRQQLQGNREALASLSQASADLASRVRSLQDISAKSDKLLSLKDATIAELQRKLATVGAEATTAASAGAALKAKAAARAPAAGKPAAKTATASTAPWYLRPWAWGVAGLIVLVLIALAVLGRRKHPVPEGSARGPLADPDDVAPGQYESPVAPEPEAAVGAEPAVARLESDLPEADLGPGDAPGPAAAPEDPFGLEALRAPSAGEPASEESAADAPAPSESVAGEPAPDTAHAPAATPASALLAPQPAAPENEVTYVDDPVDTKLDLARAYLDMGDPASARAMLGEVLDEGTQVQKDAARRLLADAAG